MIDTPDTSPPKHTCNDGAGPYFGRLRPADCARCAELANGAPPRPAADWIKREKQIEADVQRAHAAHFAPNGPHARGECGPVCTFGDW